MQFDRAPQARAVGILNAVGLWNLFLRDQMRFYRYWIESLVGPLVSSALFLAVFALAGARTEIAGFDLTRFVAPGILAYGLIDQAFKTSAVGLMYDKLEGMIGDVLAAPLKPLEILAGYALSAVASALVTFALVAALFSPFAGFSPAAPHLLLPFAFLGALLFALFGVLVGLWADRWDNYGAAEIFLILPLGLLSGAFFPLAAVPEAARLFFYINPVFHIVDGLRFSLIGYSDGNPGAALAALVLANALLVLIAWRLIAKGYKIKS
jgi:ABC-2 type transport system permease protein